MSWQRRPAPFTPRRRLRLRAMITETIFQIPGIGYISYEAMLQGDIPFAMFYTTFLMVLTQVSLILSDIMYAVVDPRVRVN